MQPIPVDRYLVPAAADPLPDTFTTFANITDAVPQTFKLDATWQATLVIPTGLGTVWRDAGTTTTILDSTDESTGFNPGQPLDVLARPPARFIVRGPNGAAYVLPLVLGARTQTVGIEIVVTGFTINAGTMRGAAGTGSSISFAWRRTTAAVDQFSTPPMNDYVRPRLALTYRLQSWTNFTIVAADIVKRTVKPLREIITWR